MMEQKDDIREKIMNMSRQQRRRMFIKNKKHINGMSWKEFSKNLPKKQNDE